MTRISLPTGFTYDITDLYGDNCVTPAEVEAFAPTWRKSHKTIEKMRLTGVADGHLSKDGVPEKVRFFRLPHIDDAGINTPDRLTYIESFADVACRRVDAVVFYGVGGSYLGGKVLFDVHCGAVWNLLPHKERQGRPQIFFAGNNADPRSLADLLRLFKSKSARNPGYTVMNVIVSKSGTTIEPMTGYMVMAEKLHAAGIANETVAVPAPAAGEGETLLHRLAREAGWPVFFIPDGIGGRFSVFSEAALLLGAFIGFPVRDFLAGARAMDDACRSDDIMQNPALMNAVLKFLAAKNHGRVTEVFMPYAECLKALSEWYVQLLAESLGKRFDRDGRQVNYGRTPIPAVGTTDMHAQTQEHQDGPQDKVVQFVVLKHWPDDLAVPSTYAAETGLAPFCGLRLSDIMAAACAANGTALAEDNRPSAVFELPELNAFHLGELMYMLCLSVAYEGELANVDAFDQPGVEIYKRHLKKTLKNLGKR